MDDFAENYKELQMDTAEETEVTPVKEIDYPNSTYLVVSKIGYLLGVPKAIFERGQLDMEHFLAMEQNKNCRLIRNLCIIRTCIEQNYGKIYSAFRNEIKNLHTLPEYVDADAINQLSKDGIPIIKANYPLDKYIIDINNHIANRINNCQSLMPIWLKWSYIRSLFIMPNGTKPEGVRAAGFAYSTHKTTIPSRCT